MEELKNINPFEILLIDEYADRLKVGRSIFKKARYYDSSGQGI